MASKLYTTEELLFDGRAYPAGSQIEISNDKQRERLLEAGQVSTSKPAPAVVVTDEGTGAAVTVDITTFSDDELLAEVDRRGLVGAGSKVDYAELSTDELKELCEKRELEVERSDGKKGAPLQADYVAALEAADAND